MTHLLLLPLIAVIVVAVLGRLARVEDAEAEQIERDIAFNDHADQALRIVGRL